MWHRRNKDHYIFRTGTVIPNWMNTKDWEPLLSGIILAIRDQDSSKEMAQQLVANGGCPNSLHARWEEVSGYTHQMQSTSSLRGTLPAMPRGARMWVSINHHLGVISGEGFLLPRELTPSPAMYPTPMVCDMYSPWLIWKCSHKVSFLVVKSNDS